LLFLYFSPQQPGTDKQAILKTEQPEKSPYLKAILSGATRLLNSGKVISLANPDREAAIRYIKESTLMRK
jgi:hypothetical protein